MSSAAPRQNKAPSLGCGYLVCLALGLGGLALLYLAQERFAQRRQPEGWIAGTLGAALCAGAIGLIAPMQREVARAKDRLRREAEKPDQPWTWDPGWTAPNGIAQAQRRHGRALLGFGITALVLSSPVWFAIGAELEKGNHAVWVALVFPLLSLWIFAVAGLDAWRRRKYGTARFVPAEMPLALGGEMTGMVLVTRPVLASGAGRLALDCWSTRIERAGNKRTQRGETIWHVDRELTAADWSTAGGEARLFVQLPLRGGLPTTMVRAAADVAAIEWRLRVETPTEGADFVAEFVLPVFAVPGREGADLPETRGTAGRRVDRAQVFGAAGVREVPQPDARLGTALEFPAGQGRKLIAAPLVMAVIFGGLASVLWFSPVPGVIAWVFGLFALLPALVLKSLWSGGGERLWIEDGDVCVQRGMSSVRRVAAATVLRVETSKNVGVGTEQFFRLVARTEPKREGHFPRRFELAAMVRGDEAATEALHWIEERLTAST